MAKLCFITLGCVKNDVDSDTLSALVAARGHSITRSPARANVIVLNTCGFITQAKEESIQKILELTEIKKSADHAREVVVFGCLVKRYYHELKNEIGEVDLFIPSTNGSEVSSALLDHLEKGKGEKIDLSQGLTTPTSCMPHAGGGLRRRADRQRTLSNFAYLKIADGCSSNCSFCSIPSIKGPYRSREVVDIVEESLLLASFGVKELVLVAQDSAAYGNDLPGRTDLRVLLAALNEVPGIRYIRLLYMKPESLSAELLEEFTFLPTLVPYFDIPIQHISAKILRSMHRAYDRKDLTSLFRSIRSRNNDAALRTALIVGYPGETEDDVDELAEFLEEVRFNNVSFFAFSPEEGTKAAALSHRVADDTVRTRLERLQGVQERIAMDVFDDMVRSKQHLPALIDTRDKRSMIKDLSTTRQNFPGAVTDQVKVVAKGHLLSMLARTDGTVFIGFRSIDEAIQASGADKVEVLPRAFLGHELYAEAKK